MTDRTPDKTNRGRKKAGKKQVAIHLTPEEIAGIDGCAERNFRTRSGQILCFVMEGLWRERRGGE
jgi:hypothetical protein